MRCLVISVFVLALAACGPAGEPKDTGAAMPDRVDPAQLVLSCAAFASLSPNALAERFGAENITTQTLPGPEGESYQATVVFPDDPTRRLEIVWNDPGATPASASVDSLGTQWRAVEGFSIGTPIADIERINVMPFKIWGFGWDYGGWVSDWNVGALSQDDDGCHTRMRFSPRNESASGAQGDSEFSSNDPAVRAADPIVSEIALMFSAAQER
jgi:hypothetical protein